MCLFFKPFKENMKGPSSTILQIFTLFLVLRNIGRIKVPNKPISNFLLLIAHPDDESMFFSPFLFHNKPTMILCLSNGDFDSKDNKREIEMKNLCNKREWNYSILDFKDGDSWKINRIVTSLIKACSENNIKSIVTFDQYGVSGHKNHISCYEAINKLNYLLKKHRLGSYMNFYCLKSTNIFEKYIISFRKINYKIPFTSYFGIENMLYHTSQLKWFRYLYIMFSNYMNYNEIFKLAS
jgi:N-acetylglucosaminylphosphatidylinositol deacetylase